MPRWCTVSNRRTLSDARRQQSVGNCSALELLVRPALDHVRPVAAPFESSAHGAARPRRSRAGDQRQPPRVTEPSASADRSPRARRAASRRSRDRTAGSRPPRLRAASARWRCAARRGIRRAKRSWRRVGHVVVVHRLLRRRRSRLQPARLAPLREQRARLAAEARDVVRRQACAGRRGAASARASRPRCAKGLAVEIDVPRVVDHARAAVEPHAGARQAAARGARTTTPGLGSLSASPSARSSAAAIAPAGDATARRAKRCSAAGMRPGSAVAACAGSR